MGVFEVIKKRRSVRKFDPQRKIKEEDLGHLLEAARWAPSAGNLQSWYFVVVRTRETKEQLAAAATGQDFIAEAPAVIVSCADLERCTASYGSRGEELYAIQDATIATQNMFLAATEMGLGACWVGAFDEDQVAEILKLEGNLRPVAILPIGYPLESPKPPPRRPLSEISKKI